MIAVDTNILVRYAVKDDPKQTKLATSFIKENNNHFAQALTWYQAGMDFADALHLIGSEKLDSFATLDKRLLNKANEIAVQLDILYLD